MSLRLPRDVDDLLNYRLGRLVALSSAPVIRLCEGRYGVSRREWRVIGLLAAHGTLAPSVLAERCGLDRSRTSRTITRLVEKKLASRDVHAADPRRAQVSLTEAGRRMYDELFAQVAGFNRELAAVLDDATLDALEGALQRLMVRARELNLQFATDVQADRRHGGSRRRWAKE